MSIEITITDHPACADHPLRPGEKLVVDGKPVPLFPDHKAVRLDGVIVGYVLPGNRISLIRPANVLTQPVVNAIEAKVKSELGKVQAVKDISTPVPAQEVDNE